MEGFIIGIFIVIVLIFGAALWRDSKHKNAWSRQDNVKYAGNFSASGNSADGNVRYLGNFTSQDECETECGENTWCKAYTWHDGSGTTYANQCFGMSNVAKVVPETSYYSGQKVGAENFNAVSALGAAGDKVGAAASGVIGGVSNTLQRRLGMGSAGASAGESFGTASRVGTFDGLYGELFTSGDVAAHTMQSGYYNSSVLPI